ncbi:hypothetical protein ABZ942_02825 [Nocardia sp. NPDC046473]
MSERTEPIMYRRALRMPESNVGEVRAVGAATSVLVPEPSASEVEA